MRLLILDTATEALSVALYDGRQVVAHRFEVIGRGHAEQALPLVHDMLEAAGWPITSLTGVAVGRGPGAFTGVRIGVSVAQGLAFALDLPTLGISDLQAVAVGAWRRAVEAGIEADAVVVALDARMGELYAALCVISAGAPELRWEALCAPTDLLGRVGNAGKVILAGHGFLAHPDLAAGFTATVAVYGDQLPDSIDMATLAADGFTRGLAVLPENLEPVYLRDDVATRSGR